MKLGKDKRQCKNCNGKGTVGGVRKRERDNKKVTRMGKCFYCGGLGYIE